MTTTGAVVATGHAGARASAPARLADGAYAQIKKDIFDFQLVPGDRFSEAEVAERLGISRTPVREALFRLQGEGYLDVTARSGWVVLPLDFEQLECLYDLRTVLELEAIRRLCQPRSPMIERSPQAFEELTRIWLVNESDRITNAHEVAALNQAFYASLVNGACNPEIARVHREVSERIRIILKLTVTESVSADAMYIQNIRVINAIETRDLDLAAALLDRGAEATMSRLQEIQRNS